MDYFATISTILKYILVVIVFLFTTNILKDILYYIKKESKEKVAILRFGGEESDKIAVIRDNISVGRAAENDVTIKDDAISKRQFHIKKTNKGYNLIDLKSANGTFVNGELVKSVILKNKDIIKIGDEIIVFEERIRNVK
ncbi:FHA domain-containing protein [Ezakiella coagulans]|uniref:FHA domain-containing protein n=1 Tax=Ezakiella coagulans TaxID=46507 RepID=A0A2U1E2G2_9FIRM|nr:FHA domain-containing protein [Ezakiella coagulans]PVY94138.1 FHA domain-containing protein [Ezakiella coagulans]